MSRPCLRRASEALARIVAVSLAACAWGCDTTSSAVAPDSAAVFSQLAAAGSFRLSSTGLYQDIERKELARDVREFEPAYALWSDGARKRRWLRLPEGAKIDSSEMDHWQFPRGTVLFKEFANETRRIETRVIARTGEGPRDYWMGAFVWNDDESDADFVPNGRRDARGSHDVPSSTQCGTCHNGEPGRVLGFSAVQQPNVVADMLTHLPATPFAPPADAAIANALGYLHANCGHCHNPNGSARPDTDMNLRLSVADRTAADASAYRTTIARDVQSFRDGSHRVRVAPGRPAESALWFRMTERQPSTQMPPLGTEQVDESGVETVRRWIAAM